MFVDKLVASGISKKVHPDYTNQVNLFIHAFWKCIQNSSIKCDYVAYIKFSLE